MSLLGNFSSSSKSRVYLSVTPGVGLEMIQLDLASSSVSNYALRELAYNEMQKDIVDYDNFKNAVADMYAELGIDPKTEVIINMPLVLLGQMQLGLLLPNDAVAGAIQSEIEQTYIFRRVEPVISWLDTPVSSSNAGKETRPVIYAAIQENVVEKLRTALAELGSVLVGIENSLSSTFRALEYMNLTQEQMQPNMTWNLLIVNSTGYSIASMSGKNLIEYYEEPLPIKSYEGDEIYDAIAESVKITLTSYPANYLYVVSDTDQVSSELLVSKLNTTCTVDFLENNSFKKQDSLIPTSLNVIPSYASKISLQAIGCALAEYSDFPLKFSFVSEKVQVADSCKIPIGEHELVVTQSGATKLAIAIGAPIILLLLLISFVMLPNAVSSQQNKSQEIQNKLADISKELDNYGDSPASAGFDLKNEVENGVKANRSKLLNYIAAGDSIPNNVWLTYFMTQGDGLVDIKGESTDVGSVYAFFKNMRDSLIGTKLKLQKLEMDTKSVEAAVAGAGSDYKFEITNMTNDQLTALNNPQPEGEENPDGGENPPAQAPPEGGLMGSEPVQP